MRLSQSLLEKLLAARAEGATLCQAADAAGVHVATVCRWQRSDPEFHQAMREAKGQARSSGWCLTTIAQRRILLQIALYLNESTRRFHCVFRACNGRKTPPSSEPDRNAAARPHVCWRRDCPLCRARVVVRTARGGARFWRCGRWPLCPWASWRPRAPRNCRRCGGPCFWSHSRKSTACGACGMRTKRRTNCVENEALDGCLKPPIRGRKSKEMARKHAKTGQ